MLSIDGGGMRGIYSAAYLAALESGFCARRQLSKGLDIGKAFQLIVGTSTGAIIGCALALGVSPSTIVSLYRDHGSAIFPRRMPSGFFSAVCQLWTRPKHLAAGELALREALRSVFQATTVADVWEQRRIALAIPAVNMMNFRSWVFKTPHDHNSNHRDDAYSLVDVCMASSAAPLYRSMAAIKHASVDVPSIFVDGGLWANNPVLVAMCEGLRMTTGTDDDIEIYSLGTCGRPEGELVDSKSVHRGLYAWKLGGEAAKVSLAAQEFAFDMMAKFLLPHLKRTVRVVRFPSDKIPAALLQFLDLDETSAKGLNALVAQAHQDANMTNSQIQDGTGPGAAIRTLFQSIPEVHHV